MLTTTQFHLICEEAYRNGTPRGFERAILREYLQCEIMATLSELPGSESLALIGGTGLRLLWDLDRFSEDLDFDNCGLPVSRPLALFNELARTLARRGYAVHFTPKHTKQERGGKLIFKGLLFALGLSPHHDETLFIKLEYTTPTPRPKTEVRLLNRFGFTAQIMTESLSVLCARKIFALLNRRRLQPRDLYDLVWFFSRRIAPDVSTLRTAEIPSHAALLKKLIPLFDKITPQMKEYERDLAPLLLDPSHARRIHTLPELAQKILVGSPLDHRL
ncbi:MAG: nucleotidyl transferase AbiEii/AbiGii toxin family protein [bacterium]|nr:nucleotidyl transferase AbiEii/AbiGii toxin family protein [bacterium]